jgi:hypothetical protein
LSAILSLAAPNAGPFFVRGINSNGTVVFGQAGGSHAAYGFAARLTDSGVVANAGPDQSVGAADATCQATVIMDGSLSTGSGLTYSWSEGGVALGTGVNASFSLGVGAHTISLTVTDDQGQSDSDSVSVTVQDITPPVPNLATLPTLSAICSVTVTPIPGATDACGGVLIKGTTVDPLVYTVPGTYTVTWKYTDKSGNSTPQTQTIIVQAPAITALVYTGATSGTAGTPMQASATLTLGSGKKTLPLAGQTVTFNLGTRTANAVTDSKGVAQVKLTAPSVPGNYPVSATFAGDCLYAPSAVTKNFSIKKK